jgi:hypothetical protein
MQINFRSKQSFCLRRFISASGNIGTVSTSALGTTRLSIRFCFENASLSSLSPEYSREEFYDYIEYAVMGIQEKLMQIKPKLEEFEPIRNQSIRFLKALMKGMEK